MPNAYLVGIEEATNNDFQDYVYIIRNVTPQGRHQATSTRTAHVDGHDFLARQRGLGTTAGATAGDGRRRTWTADVDAADLGIWPAQYGLNTAAAAPAAVPEFAAVLAPQADDSCGLGLTGGRRISSI